MTFKDPWIEALPFFPFLLPPNLLFTSCANSFILFWTSPLLSVFLTFAHTNPPTWNILSYRLPTWSFSVHAERHSLNITFLEISGQVNLQCYFTLLSTLEWFIVLQFCKLAIYMSAIVLDHKLYADRIFLYRKSENLIYE